MPAAKEMRHWNPEAHIGDDGYVLPDVEATVAEATAGVKAETRSHVKPPGAFGCRWWESQGHIFLWRCRIAASPTRISAYGGKSIRLSPIKLRKKNSKKRGHGGMPQPPATTAGDKTRQRTATHLATNTSDARDSLTDLVARLIAEASEQKDVGERHRAVIERELRSRLAVAEAAAAQYRKKARDTASKLYHTTYNFLKRKMEAMLVDQFGTKWQEFYKLGGTGEELEAAAAAAAEGGGGDDCGGGSGGGAAIV
eukprot:jgi/Tetstr1/421073/TSEL_012118.t1